MTPEHEARLKAVRNRLMDAVKRELSNGDVSSMELLAIIAHTTGACIALQDQRKVTPSLALEVVSKNIEAGNQEAMSEMLSARGLSQ